MLSTGSRRQVWNETAKATTGGLEKKDLLLNKRGRIVSLKKHKTAKKAKTLAKAGFKPKKGAFKLFSKGDGKTKKNRK